MDGTGTEQHTLAVGDVVTQVGGTATMTLVAIDELVDNQPDGETAIAECAWLDEGGAPHREAFLLGDLLLVAGARHRDGPASELPVSDATTTTEDEPETPESPTTFELLVGFLNWLGTRDEIVGPLSRIHPSNPSQAPRLAAEYLSEQA